MARLKTFRNEIELLVNRSLSPEARQKQAANYARGVLAKAQDVNRTALGEAPKYRQFVDGRANVPLESVNPDNGVIIFKFDLRTDMLREIGRDLVLLSPVLTGRYRDNHLLLADGVEIDVNGEIPAAKEYLFVNVLPYARKIERGLSDDAPEGVYKAVELKARRRFGNIATIKLTYRSLSIPYVALGGRRGGKTASAATRAQHEQETATRNPAILIKMR